MAPLEDEDFRTKKARAESIVTDVEADLHTLYSAQNWLRENSYSRPKKGWYVRLLNPLMGPEPELDFAPQINHDDMDDLPSYQFRAFMLAVAAISTLLVLIAKFQWMLVTPLSVVSSAFSAVIGETFGTLVAFFVCFAALQAGLRDTNKYGTKGKFLDRLALTEELWFRSGAEGWSTFRRISTTVAFGLLHVTNLIYPAASILVVTLVGGVFMFEYLRVYAVTGSRRKATMASTKFHAAYNRWALAYLVIAISLPFLADKVFG